MDLGYSVLMESHWLELTTVFGARVFFQGLWPEFDVVPLRPFDSCEADGGMASSNLTYIM